MRKRVQQISTMLERGGERGETALHASDVADHILAPLFMRALFGEPVTADFAEGLVDFLLASVRKEAAHGT